MNKVEQLKNKILLKKTRDLADITDTPHKENKLQIMDKTIEGERWKTPSDAPWPVFLMCPPIFVDNSIANNVWIKKLKGEDKKIDYNKFQGEWFNLCHLIQAGDGQILLAPAKDGLQDQCYCNATAYLPHVKNEPTIILSNFTADGRAGEEDVAGRYLTEWGYKCVKSPHNFEGCAELKFLRDDLYFGGYGVRTDEKTYDWIEKNYGGHIIKINSQDDFLYHLDCLLFVLNKDEVMVCTEILKQSEIKSIEKVANIHPVTRDDAMECVCNSIKVGDMLLNSSDLEFLKKRDPDYKKEYKKNEHLEKICSKIGMEIMYTPMTEAGKSGAALSCFVSILKHIR